MFRVCRVVIGCGSNVLKGIKGDNASIGVSILGILGS